MKNIDLALNKSRLNSIINNIKNVAPLYAKRIESLNRKEEYDDNGYLQNDEVDREEFGNLKSLNSKLKNEVTSLKSSINQLAINNKDKLEELVTNDFQINGYSDLVKNSISDSLIIQEKARILELQDLIKEKRERAFCLENGDSSFYSICSDLADFQEESAGFNEIVSFDNNEMYNDVLDVIYSSVKPFLGISDGISFSIPEFGISSNPKPYLYVLDLYSKLKQSFDESFNLNNQCRIIFDEVSKYANNYDPLSENSSEAFRIRQLIDAGFSRASHYVLKTLQQLKDTQQILDYLLERHKDGLSIPPQIWANESKIRLMMDSISSIINSSSKLLKSALTPRPLDAISKPQSSQSVKVNVLSDEQVNRVIQRSQDVMDSYMTVSSLQKVLVDSVEQAKEKIQITQNKIDTSMSQQPIEMNYLTEIVELQKKIEEQQNMSFVQMKAIYDMIPASSIAPITGIELNSYKYCEGDDNLEIQFDNVLIDDETTNANRELYATMRSRMFMPKDSFQMVIKDDIIPPKNQLNEIVENWEKQTNHTSQKEDKIKIEHDKIELESALRQKMDEYQSIKSKANQAKYQHQFLVHENQLLDQDLLKIVEDSNNQKSKLEIVTTKLHELLEKQKFLKLKKEELEKLKIQSNSIDSEHQQEKERLVEEYGSVTKTELND